MQILDETLDLNKSQEYKLSILLKKDGLSFIILDTKVNKIVAYKSIKIDQVDNVKEYCYFINKVLNQEEFVKSNYLNIDIIYNAFKSITVPENFYTDDKKDEIFKLNLELLDNEKVIVNSITNMGAKKLFAVPNCINEFITERFKNIRILHQTSPIIYKYLKNKETDVIVVNLHTDFFDMMVFKNKQLVLDNSFKFKTKEDFLYYLLFSLEQLGLDPKEQKIQLFSDLSLAFKIINFSKKYFANIQTENHPKGYNFSYLFSKEDINKITAQILAFECE